MKKPTIIELDHGSGGLASQELISGLLFAHFKNQELQNLEDCAILPAQNRRIAISTDSYVVDPLFFPGGDIGKLAVHGTINDLVMRGAQPLALSLALIIEEGLPFTDLERIAASIGEAAAKAGVEIVTGDTKVVPRTKADKIFINTTGIGTVPDGRKISGKNARPGDAVLISGTIADHGITIMGCQAGLSLDGQIRSDTMALHRLVETILDSVPDAVHVLRDPTRGGLATTLCEIASSSSIAITIEESRIPLHPSVNAACELIGLDPLYLANEGKCIVICKQQYAEDILTVMQNMPEGKDAALIGRVEAGPSARVTLTTSIGGSRLIEPLTGQPLPRIC